MHAKSVLVFVIWVLAGIASAAQSESRIFTPDDAMQLMTASSPTINPAGDRIAYVRTTFDQEQNKTNRRIWIVDTSDGKEKAIGGKTDQYEPRWSPDGQHLAFTATDKAGKAHIYIYSVKKDRISILTKSEHAARNLTWSPDGKFLAFSASIRKTVKSKEIGTFAPKLRGNKRDGDGFLIITHRQFKADGAGYIEPSVSDLFMVSLDDRKTRQLTDNRFQDHGPLSFTPDGTAIIFSSSRQPLAHGVLEDSDLYKIILETGESVRLTAKPGPDDFPTVSPDGRTLAWTGFNPNKPSYEGYRELYVMDLENGAPRSLTASLNRSVQQPHWSPDGGGIMVTSTERGVTRVLRIDLQGNTEIIAPHLTSSMIDRPYSQDGPFPEPRFSISKQGIVATTYGDAYTPPEIVTYAPNGAEQKWTDLNPQLGESIRLGKVTAVSIKSSFDKLPIDMWMITPPDFDPQKKYPMILEIHGGPSGSYGPNFTSQLQLYASAGYIVVYSNPRGSSSYGVDFARPVVANFPSHDYDDLMSVVDAAINMGNVDSDNLFVTGGSAGGALTAWIVGKTNRFRAAVAQKPPINWMSQLLNNSYYEIVWSIFSEKLPWQNAEALWMRSPLSLIDNVTTPTMLLVGQNDFVTPVSEAEQYYTALQLKGVPSALVLMPGINHNNLPDHPNQFLDATTMILEWFETFKTEN